LPKVALHATHAAKQQGVYLIEFRLLLSFAFSFLFFKEVHHA
jgi:hypothetical protein